MAQTTLQINTNLEEYFKKLAPKIQEWQVNFLTTVAEEVRDLASDLAPMDTGLLQNSIDYRQVEQRKKLRTKFQIGVFGSPFYARLQEDGFTQRDGSWNPGNPYLRPALYQVGVQMMDRREIGAALRRHLDG